MRQCAVCGAWNQPGDVYCQNCGELMPQERSAVKEPLFVRVKRACGSPIFLVAVVLYSVYTLVTIGMTIFEWIQNPNGTWVLMQYFAQQMKLRDLATLIGEYTTAVLVITALVQFITLLPRLLAMIGFWMFYAACKRQGDAPVRTSGLSFVKVSPILNLICVSFGILFSAIGVVGAFIAMIATGEEIVVISFVVMLILLAATILSLIYYIGVLRTISAVRTASSTGAFGGRISMFVVVWNFILAAGRVITVAFGFYANRMLNVHTLADLISGLSVGLFYVLISAALLIYRSKVESELMPAMPVVPVIPVPQYAQAYRQPQYGAQPPQQTYGQPQYGAQPPQQTYSQPQYGAQPAQQTYSQPQYGAQPVQQLYDQPQDDSTFHE